MNVFQMTYLAWWWTRAKFFGRKKPLQSVIFISDRCNLSCKHCSVYNHKNPHNKTYAQIRKSWSIATRWAPASSISKEASLSCGKMRG